MEDLPATKKSLGQHWLTDLPTLEAICDAGNINSNDTVLEIGPGTGTLTEILVKKAKQVIAVEFDETLSNTLQGRIKSVNLTVVNQDILRFDLTTLPPNYKVIANIPYYLTSNLIRVLSESTNRANTVVLLIQKEVAERVAAKPGKMSLLSVTAQYYWNISLGQVVQAKMFIPPPKVDSQILIMENNNRLHSTDTKQLFRLVSFGFSSRRKTLVNSLSGSMKVSKTEITGVLKNSGIDPGARPQTLAIQDWIKLLESVENHV